MSDRSFGVHVAEVAHFPPEVVRLARDKVAELEAFGAEDTAQAASADGTLPSSQPQAQQTFVSGSKRVKSEAGDEDEQVPAPAWISELLHGRPAADLQDNHGGVRADEMTRWLSSIPGAPFPQANGAAKMEL